MIIDKAKAYLDRYESGEIWALITIGASKGPCGTSIKIEPPATFNPILMYAWLEMLEVDVKVIREQLLEKISPAKKERFLSEVKRFFKLAAEDSFKRDIQE